MGLARVYAPSGYTELYWVSSPEANHSRNLAGRPDLSIVVFDSRVAIGEGQGVYMTAVAQELTGADLERGIEIFSRVSESHGAKPWTLDDVRPPAAYALVPGARVRALGPGPGAPPDQRTPVRL